LQLAVWKHPANLIFGSAPFGTPMRLLIPRLNSIKNYLIVFLALGLAGASVIAWRKGAQLADLNAQSIRQASVKDARVGDLERKLAELQSQLQSVKDQFEALQSQRGGAANPDRLSDANDGFPGNVAGLLGHPISPGMLAAMNTLEFQKLIGIEAAEQLDSQYAALFKKLSRDLNLRPDQIDQFKSLLVQKQQAVIDAVQAAGGQGPGSHGDPAALRKAVTEAQALGDEQIKSRLGNAAYLQYRNYEQTLPERNVLNELQQSLSYTQDPLTEEQTEQLIPVIAATQPKAPGSDAGVLTNSGNAGAVITSEALLQAKNVLSQVQMKALEQLQAAQQARQRLELLVRSGGQSANNGATKGAGAP
jgi:hypothetical protein